VADAPDQLDLTRHRDAPPALGVWTRRAFLALFAVFALAGLANAFGQSPSVSRGDGPGVTLRVEAPTSVRGGLLFEGRIDIHASRKLDQPTLVFGPGWTEGMSVNTIEPAADTESSRDGRLVLRYGPLQKDDDLTIWLQFQVNPTNVGRRDQDLELDEGTRQLVRLQRTVTVFP
jgi:hypothetical protein